MLKKKHFHWIHITIAQGLSTGDSLQLQLLNNDHINFTAQFKLLSQKKCFVLKISLHRFYCSIQVTKLETNFHSQHMTECPWIKNSNRKLPHAFYLNHIKKISRATKIRIAIVRLQTYRNHNQFTSDRYQGCTPMPFQ